MAAKLSFLVAATVAALAIKQANSRPKPSESKEVKTSKDEEKEERLEEQSADFFSFEQDEEEEDDDDEYKVKTVSSAISSAQSNVPPHGGVAGEEELLSEFECLLSGEVSLPLPRRRRPKSNAAEVERLRRLVKEMEEREVMHEGELLEYYGLKEQEPDVAELRKQLETTAVEVETLGTTVRSLRAERERIEEAAAEGSEAAKAELEAARSAAAELQRQVAGLRAAAEAELEAARRAEAELERQVAELRAAVAELEAEVAELRRKNRELENEKEEMAMKLDAAESRAIALSINWP